MHRRQERKTKMTTAVIITTVQLYNENKCSHQSHSHCRTSNRTLSTKITNHHGRGLQIYVMYQGNQLHVRLVEFVQDSADPVNQGWGAWPYAGLSLLKVKKSLIVIQMVQTLHKSANILHIYVHKNVLTMFQ